MIKVEQKELNIRYGMEREGTSGAFVIRWIGCSLGCGICYVSKKDSDPNLRVYKSRELEAVNHVKKFLNEKPAINARTNNRDYIRWTRIQGGEPFLYKERAIATIDLAKYSLNWMCQQDVNLIPRVVIQTNGILFSEIPSYDIIEIVNRIIKVFEEVKRGRICIEVSFKGPNQEITEKYALARIPGKGISNIFNKQINGFKNLREAIINQAWNKCITQIAIYPVAGFTPCIKGFIPIDDTKNEVFPLFHPYTWDLQFKETIDIFKEDVMKYKDSVYRDYYYNMRTRYGSKILVPMETMEPAWFQRGWTAYLKSNSLMKDFAKRYIKVMDINNKSLKIFRQDILGIVEELPKEIKNNFEEKIQDLKEYFYEAEPENHYPYL